MDGADLQLGAVSWGPSLTCALSAAFCCFALDVLLDVGVLSSARSALVSAMIGLSGRSWRELGDGSQQLLESTELNKARRH